MNKPSYTAPTPSIWANQQLGLVTQTHIATHITASFTKLHFGNAKDLPTQPQTNDRQGDDEWKFFDGPLKKIISQGSQDSS